MCSHFQPVISLKPAGQLQSNFMCSIIGVGERLRFADRIRSLVSMKTYGSHRVTMEENGASAFPSLFLIEHLLYLQVNGYNGENGVTAFFFDGL